MPITFSVNQKDGYFNSKFAGKVSDGDLLASWRRFCESGEWTPELNLLVDLTESNLSGVTLDGIQDLSNYIDSFIKKHSVPFYKVAIYAPNDLPFGLSRMYEATADYSSREIKIFRDLSEAKLWLFD